MVTKESLANMGVQSAEKGVQPDWWFISYSMFWILFFLFIVMGVFVLAYNSNIKGTKLLAKSGSTLDSSLYYDKIAKSDDLQYKSYCCGLVRVKKSKVSANNETSSSSSDDEQKKKIEYAVKYKDLEVLLADFHRAQEVLNKQLLDREAKSKRTVDEEGNLVENLSNEDSLVKEVQSLLNFVKQNRQVLNTALGERNDAKEPEHAAHHKHAHIEDLENVMTKKIAMAMKTLVQKSAESEKFFNSKLVQRTKESQQHAYEQETVRNDQLKQKMLEEYEQRLQTSKINEKDRDALLAELHAKMSNINDLAAEEQDHQNHNLNEMLARRKAKKDKLQQVLVTLGDKKIKEDDRYQQKLVEIKQKEMDDKKAVDTEMDVLRSKSTQEINVQLAKKRRATIAQSEQRLEDFKRRQGKGNNPEAELEFADMLAEYGNKVKKVDSDLNAERAKQQEQLEEKLKDRKQSRLREIEEQRKQKEQMLNTDTVNNNSKLNTEMKQIEALLNPIKDEQARMEIILRQNQTDVEKVISTTEDTRIELSSEGRAAQRELETNDDKKEIAQVLNKIDVENEIKRREIEN